MIKKGFIFPVGPSDDDASPTMFTTTPTPLRSNTSPARSNGGITSHIMNTSITEERSDGQEDQDEEDGFNFMKPTSSPYSESRHHQHHQNLQFFSKPTMSHHSHRNANNDSYNSINSIDTDSSFSSNSVFSMKLPRYGSQSSVSTINTTNNNSTGFVPPQLNLNLQQPPNPFGNFDSQMISPISTTFDRKPLHSSSPNQANVPSASSASSTTHHKIRSQQLPKGHTPLNQSSSSFSSLNLGTHSKTFSASSLNLSSPNINLSPQMNRKFVKYPLQQGVESITGDELQTLINEYQDSMDDENDLLIVDVRSYLEFNRSHITNSVNFNLPSTLLKRQGYDLNRCLANISSGERKKLTSFLSHSMTEKATTSKVLIYDDFKLVNDEIPLNIHGTINKFLEFESYEGDVLVLNVGFQSFKEGFSDLTTDNIKGKELKNGKENGSPERIRNPQQQGQQQEGEEEEDQPPDQPPQRPRLGSRSLSLANLPSFHSQHSPSGQALESPPCLSKFKLPAPASSTTTSEFDVNGTTTTFKIRHNEEVIFNQTHESDHLIAKEFKRVMNVIDHPESQDSQLLPLWLRQSIKDQSRLSEDFKRLEIQEKERVNGMIRDNKLSFGIELGFKNRYKDIFPYENTRVTIPSNPSFYFNGNIIRTSRISPELKGTYLATQAPLKTTMDDFSTVIRSYGIKLIIALTDQFEAGMEKCHAYWNDTCYFQILDTVQVSKNLVLRKLLIRDGGYTVWQLQMLNWFDFDVMNEPCQLRDLLTVIRLESHLVRMGVSPELALVHCSAGCGRTGSFITLATILNSNLSRVDEALRSNMIYKVVEGLREMRISMVQSLRQYLFVFEVLVYWFQNDKKIDDGYFDGIWSLVGGLF